MTTTSTLKQNARRLLVGAGLALTLPLAAFAQSAQPAPGGNGPRAEHHWQGGHGGKEGGMRHHGMHHGRHGHHHGMMGMLRGVKLSDAQRDKIFAIHHAAEPQVYEKFKVLRKSREDLRAIGPMTAQFDEARAKSAIDAAARAKADLQLMRLRSAHEIYGVLTAEQKAQVDQNRQNFMQHRMSMNDREGHGDRDLAQNQAD
ncbi:MAG TPA: Spy/CpxP family protein refolding chaperone [Burkholderiales bacterium]|jgi:Spy/CpxP family protein refolding chaperone